jgi:glycosyltransferase involved in cell wall biosynthesis
MSKPKISILTSVFNCDKFMAGFLDSIESQTVFTNQCELLLLDCGPSPCMVPELKIAKRVFYNIKYAHLDKDPGLYEAWNTLLKHHAEGEYITNANTDDRQAPWSLEVMAAELDANPDIDLVYGRVLVTDKENETFFRNTASQEWLCNEFSINDLITNNSPHCQPMWRKSLHDRFGYFDSKYSSAADSEFWLRCATGGAKFKKINKQLGLYYVNPQGISTKKENFIKSMREVVEVRRKYKSDYFLPEENIQALLNLGIEPSKEDLDFFRLKSKLN